MLFFDRLHIHLSHMLVFREILVKGVWRVDWVVGLSSVLACEFHDDLRPAWVLCFKFSDIIGASMDDDPAVIIAVMFADFLATPPPGRGGFIGEIMVHGSSVG